MFGVLVKYNKVTNLAFDKLSKRLSKKFKVSYADVAKVKKNYDSLNSLQVDRMLNRFSGASFVIIGDMFWNTGQEICRWCRARKVPCYFLQHGQWIYVANKKNPRFAPHYVLVYGENVRNMCQKWPMSKRAKFVATGNPRYDKAHRVYEDNNRVYFSPPVIEELTNGGKCLGTNKFNLRRISKMKGLDKEVELYLQPHYREGAIRTLKDLFPDAVYFEPPLDPLPIVQECSRLICSRNSTMVLDAIAYGKQVLFMEWESSFDKKVFFPRGYFKNFGWESESLTEFFKNLHKDTRVDWDQYEKEAAPYLILGNASKRISKLIGA